ncbi:MAG: DUF2232 domain-containing protein [Variibacter sp.]|nr:DUF2232 domain-containing protein [Variibacter sp.]
MIQIVLIGVAAGVASALLFASFASGTLISVPLFYLAPLPILIVALGWSHLTGLVAALVASAAIGFLFNAVFLLSFLVGVGLPSWWLAYLALLGRPGEGPDGMEWYPTGRLVMWVTGLASLIVALVLLTIATDAEGLRTSLRQIFEPLLREVMRNPAEGAERSARSFVRVMLEYPDLVLPPAAGVLTTVVTAFTLWLAARIVKISGRLRRPWPDLAAMTFPALSVPVLAAVLLGAVMLSGLPGIYALIAAACLLTAFGFLGFAVLHALTRRLSGRGFILTGVYAAVAMFGWPMLLAALLGLIEMALNLRGRFAAPPPNPPTPDFRNPD